MDSFDPTSCRTCLGPLELPINLFESSYNVLVDVLQRLLGFQFYAEGEEFKVCRHCQEKLLYISEFQIVCSKSLESLRYLIKTERSNSPFVGNEETKGFNPVLHVEVTRCNKIEELLFRKDTEKDGGEDDGSYSPIFENDDDDCDYKPSKKRKKYDRAVKVKKIKDDGVQRRANKQFPFGEVVQAIEEVHSHRNSINNIPCLFCTYVSKNYLILRSHIRKKHEHVKDWCENCNTQVEDLENHKTGCNKWVCKFCQRPFPRMKLLTRHLELHCRSRVINVPFRLRQFSADEVLQALGEFRGRKNVDRRQCVVCKVVCAEVGRLKNHMAKSHKSVSTNWCMFCNVITKDLQAHKEADKCNGERCKFCDRIFTKRKFLSFHLRQHCRQEFFKMEKGSLVQVAESTVIASTETDVTRTTTCEKPPQESTSIDVSDSFSDNMNIYKHTESLKEETASSAAIEAGPILPQDDDQASEEDPTDSSFGVGRAIFPLNVVMKAIKEVQSFYTDIKKRQCIYCDFIGSNTRSLWCHIRKAHKQKDIYNWCIICNMQTDNLQKHKEDTQCHKFTCKFCQKVCTEMKNLTKHLKTHCKGDVQFKNSAHIEQLPTNEVLAAIMETHYDTKRITCCLCGILVEEMGYMKRHMSEDHKAEFPRWCIFCNTVTKGLQIHKSVDKCYGVQCKFCNQTFVQIKYLRHHLRTHSRKELYYAKCKICKEKYCEIHAPLNLNAYKYNYIPVKSAKKGTSNDNESDDDLFDSMIKKQPTESKPPDKPKSQDKQVLCPVCGRVFKTQFGANCHISSHYNEPKYKCPICDKSFFHKAVMKNHQKLHNDMKEFFCHICGKGSNQRQAHRKHIETHEVKPVQCPHCDKTFYRPGVLELHMRHHTGENQFRCIPCGKSFHIKSRLLNHMEMHSNNEYVCPTCGKVLKSKGVLRRHKLIHTDNKRYKCSICPYRGEQAHQLTTHMKQHPEDAPQASKPHKCPMCFRSFSTNALLVCHIDNTHRKNSKHYLNNMALY